jgi:hypothetical protein
MAIEKRHVIETRKVKWPIAVSKARNNFARSNTGIVGSNHTLFSVFALSCVGGGLATGLIPSPRGPTDCKIYNSRINSEWEQVTEPNPSRQNKKKKKKDVKAP